MVVDQQTFEELRLGVGVSLPAGDRSQAGVLVFRDVPAGALVRAVVNRPTEIPGSTDGSASGEATDGSGTQPYIFESAPLPGPYTVGGVSVERSQARFLVNSGNGVATPVQVEPAWSAFSPTQTGALVQRGKKTHSLQMLGTTGATPNMKSVDRRLLRMRWTGTAVLTETMGNGNGTKKSFTGTFAGKNIAPGSIVATATVNGNPITIRDTGNGRLVGLESTGGKSADGTVNYITGEWTLTFPTAPDNLTDVVASSYDKDCRYKGLDVSISFDPLMA